MKFLLICFALFFASILNAQEVNGLFFNEVHLSWNKTDLYTKDQPASGVDKCGFGVDFYRLLRPDKTVNLIVGIGYSNSRQERFKIFTGRFNSILEANYTFHSLNIPIGLRINVIKELGISFEPSLFFQKNLYSKVEGEFVTSPIPINASSTKKQKTQTAIANSSGIGISLGTGVKFQLFDKAFLIRGTYKVLLSEKVSYDMDNISLSNYFLSLGYHFN